MSEIVNRVASSSLLEINLEDLYDADTERIVIDIKDNLYEGLVLREKDFRQYINNTDWTVYKGKYVGIICSADAIVPTWAYMLLSSRLGTQAKQIVFGDISRLNEEIFFIKLKEMDWEKFKDQKVIIKGCSRVPVPVSAYVRAVECLLPYASSIMYGEACSTVPVYKQKK